MKYIKTIAAFALMISVQCVGADEVELRLKKVFGDQQFVLKKYDDQLLEVVVGSTSYFLTHDGRYIFSGTVYDTQRGENLIALRVRHHRQKRLHEMPKSLSLSYPAINQSKYTVTVFTDIDCPYCRKMHDYMDEFNQMGITVNYVMLPRAGIGSKSFVKTASALCDEQPALAVTRAMAGQALSSKTCQHTLAEQLQLATDLKISSTPAIVLPDGRLKLGLVRPDQLLSILEKN